MSDKTISAADLKALADPSTSSGRGALKNATATIKDAASLARAGAGIMKGK